MAYVMGIDLGTSAVKVSVIDSNGTMVAQANSAYALNQPQSGYSEQNPESWVTGTTNAIKSLASDKKVNLSQIEGISYSGQMHGLVLLDENKAVLRPAILWNDTRTTTQCAEIIEQLGDRVIKITRNRPLEGFTLPKILWVKENEPSIFNQAKLFLLPKDYLRYRMTGTLATEYSDAAGTILLDVVKKQWSTELCQYFGIPLTICPPLLESTDFAGTVSTDYARISGLTKFTKVFAGAADNAAGAIGAGLLQPNMVLSSVGTSGVVLKYEPDASADYHGQLHFFNHAITDRYYAMGVTLAAGYSLNWFKQTFGANQKFKDFVAQAAQSRVGANGLLFTPYIVGERTPYADVNIRGSFIGIDGTTQRADFIRAVLEGIIFSFKDIMQLFAAQGSDFDTVISIGGGAKSPLWLQIQADIFNKKVVSLKNEQGPGFGAAMIASVGLGWFKDFKLCAHKFVHFDRVYLPRPENVLKYYELYQIYKQIYGQTRELSKKLMAFRKNN